MHNFYTKFNIWAAIGRKTGESWSGPCPFIFPAGVYVCGEMAGVLRSQKQQQAQFRVGAGEKGRKRE